MTAFDITENLNLTGKVFLVTGPYAGLGAETTKSLLSVGATVILAGRNSNVQSRFAESLRNDAELNLKANQLDATRILDLADLSSVSDFAKYVSDTFEQIDCLINNAGVMNTPPGRTKDGFEIQMGVNVIGHFLLAKMLANNTKRQVWLSSKGHTRFGSPRIDIEAIERVNDAYYHPRKRYQQSKLGSILMAKQFAVEYPHLKSVSVHPGLVKTNLGRHTPLLKKLFFMITNPGMVLNMKSPEEGAATQVLVATVPVEELKNGAYYADCQVIEESESAKNMVDAKMLFDYCEKMTKGFQ